jgi:methionine aminotransferase
MSKMALDYKAINLGQGFPDFNTDEKLQSLVSQAMADGFNQYPAMAGVPALREVIHHKVKTLYRRSYDADTEITVTSGATQAIMAAVLASVGPGDEVLVLEPCYDCYLPAIRLAGARAITVPMLSPTTANPSYSIDWARDQANITPRTR